VSLVSRAVENFHGGPVERYRAEMEPYEAMALREARRRLLADLSGHLLEIGAGLGQSFPLYPAHVQVTAIEPFDAFRDEARRTSSRSIANIEVVSGDAHDLAFPEGSFDGLVCSLVLCCLRDPLTALMEMRRVLKPDAPARFLEHVRSPHLPAAAIQYAVGPFWKTFDGAGCTITRNSIATIVQAGFRLEQVHEVILPGLIGLLFPGREVYAWA